MLLLAGSIQAQVDTSYVPYLIVVEVSDGSIYSGEFIEARNDSIFLEVEGRWIGIAVREIVSLNNQRTQVKEVTAESSTHSSPDGALTTWSFENPNYHRYLFAPSAFMMEKGEGYYQNLYLVGNQMSYAFTDWLTLGAGFEWISLFLGTPILFLTPKVGWKTGEKTGVGAGCFVITMPSDNVFVGIPYGVFTYGNRETNVTLGAGMMVFTDGEESQNSPAFTFNYMSRLANKLGFVFENWLVQIDENPEWIGAPGLRIMQQNSTFDIGAIISPLIISEGGIPIPYVDFVYQF